jgi:hypothetical protein
MLVPHPSARSARGIAAVVALFLAACGPRAVQPDDMSAAAHRREAVTERDEARAHMARHDAQRDLDERARVPAGDLAMPDARWQAGDPEPTGPGARELQHAAEHRAHADEHDRAAAALERFMQRDCAQVAPEMRTACPMIAPVRDVVDVSGGVRIRFAEGADVDGIVARMRCHNAYARANGYAPQWTCALYVPGLVISVAEGGTAIDLIGRDTKTVEHIRRHVREQTGVK